MDTRIKLKRAKQALKKAKEKFSVISNEESKSRRDFDDLRDKVRKLETKVQAEKSDSIMGKIFKSETEGVDDFYAEVEYFKPLSFDSGEGYFVCACITISRDFDGRSTILASTSHKTMDSSSVKHEVSEEELKRAVEEALDDLYKIKGGSHL